MNLRELKITRVASIGGKEFPFGKNDLEVKLIEVEWEGASCDKQDLFEKLIEPSGSTDESRAPNMLVEQMMEMPAHSHNRQGCKCSKIGCLKLYCQCFAKGLVCGPECICSGCQNCTGNEKKIVLAQQMANFRKPGSFKNVKAYVPERKCTCKKSQCLKNYCECHNAGMKCSPSCLCTDCHNKEPLAYFEEKDSYRMEVEVEA